MAGDTQKVLTIRLHVEDDGSVRIEKFAAGVGNLSDASDRAKGNVGDLGASIDDLGSKLDSARSILETFIGAWTLDRIIDQAKSVVMEGVAYNATLEQAQIGMGAIYTTFTKLYDAQGNQLKGQQAFNAALQVGADLTDKLRVNTLATTLLFSQVLDATRRSLSYELQYFTDKNGNVAGTQQLADFTTAFAQGATTFGLDPGEIPNNLRFLLQGRADARHARFAAALLSSIGTPDEAKQQIEEWTQQGVLIDRLSEKLAAFKDAGEMAMHTYTGALSNLHDAMQQLFGAGTEEATKALTQDILDLRDMLVTVDKQGHMTFNEESVAAIKTMAEAVVSVADAGLKIINVFTGAGGVIDTIRLFKQEAAASLLRDAQEQLPGGAATGSAISSFLSSYGVDTVLAGPLAPMLAIARSQWGSRLLGQGLDAVTPGNSVASGDTSGVFAGMPLGDDRLRDLASRGQNYLAQIDSIDALLNAPATLQRGTLSGRESFEADVGAFGAEHPDKIIDLLQNIEKLTHDGKLSWEDYDKAKKAALGGVTVKGSKPPGDESGEDAGFSNFQRWMEQYHMGADQQAGVDPLAKTLNEQAIQRQQAIDRLNQAEEKYEKSNEDWKKDRDDIDAAFNNRASDAIQKYLESYQREVLDYGKKFVPQTNDPLTDSLNKIEVERQKELDRLAEQKKKFGEVMSETEYSAQQNQINTFFDSKKVAAEQASLKKIDEETISHMKKTWEIVHDSEIESATDAENRRISLIEGADTREIESRKNANAKWAAEQLKAAQEEFGDDVRWAQMKADRISAIKKAQAAKDAEDQAAIDAEDRRQFDTKSDEWANDLHDRLNALDVNIAGDLKDALVADVQAFDDAFTKFIDDLGKGHANLTQTVDSLAGTLGEKWSKVFADILRGEETVSDAWNELQNAFNDGGALDKALAGLGIGNFIGGAVGGLTGGHNQAQVGGEIGGMIGAIWGPIGSLIGAALGSLIGSLISKGENYINVAIKGATEANLGNLPGATWGGDGHHGILDLGGGASITIDQQGLSAEGLHDLEIQLKRKIHDTMDSWAQLFQMLPGWMQDELAKLPAPKLDLTGGVEGGKEIGDTNALNTLSDFLSNKMPEAVFAAYHDSIAKALELMGVQTKQEANLFAYWGTLTGSELHDAVQRYFSAVLDANDMRTKLSDPQNLLYAAEHQINAGQLTSLQDIRSQMALTVASMSKMTDINDITAAQEHLNQLSHDYYNAALQDEEQLLEIRKQQHDANASLIEQITLQGQTPQQKLDYYYGQLTELRSQLTYTTDPKAIAAIEEKMRQYVQAAFSLAPDDAGNREHLLAILADIDKLGGQQLDNAQQELENEQKKAADLLQQAATALLGAADALNPTKPPPPPPAGGSDPIHTPGPLPHDPPEKAYAVSTAKLGEFSSALVTSTDDLRHLDDWLKSPDGKPAGYASTDKQRQQLALQVDELRRLRESMDAVVETIADTQLSGQLRVALDVYGADGLIDVITRTSVQAVRLDMQRNPDLYSSRTAR